MREFIILVAPVFWSLKNDIFRFSRSFYRKLVFYVASSCVFLFLFTRLLNIGMTKLQSMSTDIFDFLLIKGYSLIFVIIFFIQTINGFIISLNTFFQARDLEILVTSPVNRTSLFFSRLFEVHFKASWMLIIFGIPLLVASGILFGASLLYYGITLILFVAFSAIAVNIGTMFTIFFSNFFHVKRMKKVVVSVGVLAAALVITLLRVFRPERFVNPELFANLTFFVAEMKAPSFILFPNRWLSESLFGLLGKSPRDYALIFIALLLLTTYVTTLFLLVIFRRYHFQGWGLFQEGDFIRTSSGRKDSGMPRKKDSIFIRAIQRLFFVFGKKSGTIMMKDFLVQVRDVRNVHQTLILTSLIIVYLVSIASLPLNWIGYEVQLKYVVSFLNLGLILIIIASLCSRLVYPAMVSEGAFLWSVKTSPVTPGRYIWTKFLFFLIPAFLTGQLLVISSSLIIGVERPVILLYSVTAALFSLSLPGLAVAFGTSDMRHVQRDAPRAQGRTESAAYILVAIALILITLASEIAPVFLFFLKESGQSSFTRKAWMVIGGMTSFLCLLNLSVTIFSLRLSTKKIERFQF